MTRTLTDTKNTLPHLFAWLTDEKLVREHDLLCTCDGFYLVNQSLSTILSGRGIETFLDSDGSTLRCCDFFDDWFLYAVTEPNGSVYGLLKMREQENDNKLGIMADGDTPGVTVSFVGFDVEVLKRCLIESTSPAAKDLGIEINRVVAYPGQKHHAGLKAYFARPEAQAPYMIAKCYVRHMAAFARDGILDTPKGYREIYGKIQKSRRYCRIPDFLDSNNTAANRVVCDHTRIYLRDPDHLSEYEEYAILATHTGNVSYHSFAAEIRFHALFLADILRIPILRSVYASAVRADMSIGDKELQGFTPYYDLSSPLVKAQMKAHS